MKHLLSDRVIVVTGAARGLGKAFAESCANAGASAIIVADIDSSNGTACAAAIQSGGCRASYLHVDIADPASIEAFAAGVRDQYDAVDGLVNAAAIATGIGGKTFEEIDISTWDRVMQVNVRGTWLVVRALAPLLRRSTKGGRIVNIASDTALWGAPRLLHYVASKGAIISMTRALARELGPDKITVNTVAPGLIDVQATEYVPQERKDLYVTGAAIKRPGQPDDVTACIVHFLSEGSRFVTGQLLTVNGGFVLH